ncbi:MAG: acyltransferase [Telluria sp.]
MQSDRPQLDPSFSLYLDLVRFIAALLVVLTHCRQYGLIGGWQAHLIPYAGRESVIVFFVLSGFVIAYSTLSKQVSLRDYFAARLTRIGSVAVPAVLIAFACAVLIDRLYGPGLAPSYVLKKAYIYVPLHLLFMGDAWGISEVPPWLYPYWSLNYEVWYYVLFGVLHYLHGVRKAVAGTLVLAIVGYKLWLLMPIWAAGVWLYKWVDRHTMSTTVARYGWLASTLLLVAYNLSDLQQQLRMAAVSLWPYPHLPLGSAERVLADYLVCVLVVANFACARYAAFTKLDRFAIVIRRVAFFTFPLYLTHALVLGIWRAFHPHQTGALPDVVLVTIIVVMLTWLLGHGAERLRVSALKSIAAMPKQRHAAREGSKAPGILSVAKQADFPHPFPPTQTEVPRSPTGKL